MKRFKPLSLSLLVCTFFACTTTKEVPPFDYCGRNVILSKGIAKDTAVNPATTFLTEDEGVIARLRCRNLSGEHRIRWEWYDPNGRLYHNTGDHLFYSSQGRYKEEATAWHRVSIRDDKAACYPGNWQVKVYFDDELIARKDFKIEGEPDLICLVKDTPPVPPDKNKRALIIGIEEYSNEITPPAKFAKRDALLMKEYFRRFYGVPNEQITTLINGEATLGKIKDHVKKSMAITSNDTLYFYYAGHGYPYIPDKNKPSEAYPYLLPQDGNPANLKDTAYPVEELYNNLASLNAKNIYTFLDTCFSGRAGRGEKVEDVDPGRGTPEFIKVKPSFIKSRNAVGFTSSKGNQVSNSNFKRRHGLFTYWLVKGIVDKESPITRDGKVTVEELYKFIKENVSADSTRIGPERKQEPDIEPGPLDALGPELKNIIIWKGKGAY